MKDVKTDQYFQKIGATDISSSPWLIHPTIKYLEDYAPVSDVEARSMICDIDNYTDYAYGIADKYASMWEERIVIAPVDQMKIKKAA
ncbi:MAG: hypothetical protein HOE90_02655 [Bacteriovoracaceae bacterium]|jgi:hypothetical protein|nr:hypothetical protein [Bacteriovoracaceae bacterium]